MEDDDSAKTYFLKTEQGKSLTSSRQFSGVAKATYVLEDGEIEEYSGDFEGGMRTGRGIYCFNSGDCYEGGYLENKRQGLGRMIYSSARHKNDADSDAEAHNGDDRRKDPPLKREHYYGHYFEGERQGNGTFQYRNGDVYCGAWNRGKREGRGCYTFFPDGSRLSGEWKNGEFESGKWILPNGVYYCGLFANNKPIGSGVWVFRDGNQLAAEYRPAQVNLAEKSKGEMEDEDELPGEAIPLSFETKFVAKEFVTVRG